MWSGLGQLTALIHDRELIAVGVLEERHPQRIAFGFVNQVRFVRELNSSRLKFNERGIDVVNAVVHSSSITVGFTFGRAKHKADFAVLEKRQIWCFEDEIHSQNVTIELSRFRDVIDVDSYLADLI